MGLRRQKRALTSGALLALAAIVTIVPAIAAAASATTGGSFSLLWFVVHGLCVPNQRALGDPSPCLQVNIANGEDRGFAVLKTPFVPSEILFVPTAPVTGIEDRRLLDSGAPNYWAQAWSARQLLAPNSAPPIERGDIAMALNSVPGRTQNQFHIHIDCVRRDVRDLLVRDQNEFRERVDQAAVSLARP